MQCLVSRLFFAGGMYFNNSTSAAGTKIYSVVPFAPFGFNGAFDMRPSVEVENLDCDVCGAKITDFENDLFHYSGTLKGRESGHIHLCAKCNADLSPPFFDFDAALEKKRKRERVTGILKTAWEYDAWLTSNRRGSSFSTFVNEFGFDGNDSSYIFKEVEATRKDVLSRCIG